MDDRSFVRVAAPQQSHEISGDLNNAKTKRAYWAVNPIGTAIIFVHGLMGEAVGTWSNFEGLLLKSDRCQGCDLIFYKYNSTDAQTNASSTLLYKYLKKLLSGPAATINEDLMLHTPRVPDFQFKKVILVAHSLGAIICRQALLRAHKKKDIWRHLIELVLFAPAHLGSTDIAGFVSAVAETVKLKAVVPGAKLWWPVLKELEENSVILKALETETKQAVGEGKANFLAARKVIFGELDKVVNVRDFCIDEPMDVIEGKGHKDVCKPKDSFRNPVEAVLELL